MSLPGSTIYAAATLAMTLDFKGLYIVSFCESTVTSMFCSAHSKLGWTSDPLRRLAFCPAS